MKILRLDSVGGASGDMLLGVFFALGVEPEKLQHALAGLLPEPFSLRADAVCENVDHAHGFGIAMLVTAIEAIHNVIHFLISVHKTGKIAKKP